LKIEEPKYSIAECVRKNLNYDAAIKVKLEMLNKET
jgi:DNA-directed RNA polymerase beta subunit